MNIAMSVSTLIDIIVLNNVGSDVEIMTDSGWEVYATEVSMVYYNPQKKTLVLTRESGNYETYENSNDWVLLWKHSDVMV